MTTACPSLDSEPTSRRCNGDLGPSEAASRGLAWVDPISGDRLLITLSAGAGLLERLLASGFESAPIASKAPSGPATVVAA